MAISKELKKSDFMVPYQLDSIFPFLAEDFQLKIIHLALLESVATLSLASDSNLIQDPDFTSKEAAGADSEWGWGLGYRPQT